MTNRHFTRYMHKSGPTGHNMSGRPLGEAMGGVVDLILGARGPFEFVGNRPAGKFRNAANDETLSRWAQILAVAEDIKPGEGHEAVFNAFLNLGGIESEYDPARWELLSEGYPANRGW